ncbi:spc97p [Saccharomyces arboricola H-6]|uniref:Spindle pole body component n=1 Tax=Saccharomyces arboricola (strain H-6 / AS 2.3317 / CBS 10644) TaxID=1160507 RepID=J8LMS0_SACAR|nr:spc97p [Saccharomyces arboricola H-6]
MEIKEVDDRAELLRYTNNIPLLGKLVNHQPLWSTNPKLKSFSLEKVSAPDQRRIQEALVVKDLLNVLIGLEGTYIRYFNDYEPSDPETLIEFKIAKKMDPSFKTFSRRIVRYGKQYMILTKAYEIWSDASFGMVLQRFGYEIRMFLENVYLKILVERLERDFNKVPNFSIRELEQTMNETEVTKQMDLLYYIYEEICKEIEERRTNQSSQDDFNNFMDNMKNESSLHLRLMVAFDTTVYPVPKGGAIFKIFQLKILENLGDRSSVMFLKKLLNNVSQDYCTMLYEWLTQGSLNDPYQEFMTYDDLEGKTEDIFDARDRAWDTQYFIRKDVLLRDCNSEEDKNLLFKMLRTGILLKVVRTSLQIPKISSNNSDTTIQEIHDFAELMEGTNLELYVEKCYNRANKIFLKLFFEGYDLVNVSKQLQKIFLGYQYSHNVSKFLAKNMGELTKHYRHNNTANDDKLLQNFELDRQSEHPTNLMRQLLTAQFDTEALPQVLSHYLQIYPEIPENNSINDNSDPLMQASNFKNMNAILFDELSKGRTGTYYGPAPELYVPRSAIYHLKFDINIPYPLNIIISRTCMIKYQIISRYQLVLQYHSRLLDDTWIDLNKTYSWKYRGYSSTVKRGIIRTTRLLHGKMNHFIKAVMEYFNQNVIDKEVHKLEKSYKNPTLAVDIQNELEGGLTNIMTNRCLSDLIPSQLQIFDIMYKFCKFIKSMKAKLCQLDPVLYQKHRDTMMKFTNEDYRTTNDDDQEDVGYQEDTALELIQKLIEYISNASKHFDKCLQGFVQKLNAEKFDFYDSSSVDAAGIERILFSITPSHSAPASSQK